MPHFPIFLDLHGKRVLLVGAGPIAKRKLESLLAFDPQITVIAPEVLPEIAALESEGRIRLLRRPFEPSDIAGTSMVIVAASDLDLQRRVFELCSREKIPCNAVDNELYCSFLFPALVVQGDLVVGVSTSGQAPSVSATVRKLLERVLPSNLGEIVREVHRFRMSAATGPERSRRILQLTERLISGQRSEGAGT